MCCPITGHGRNDEVMLCVSRHGLLPATNSGRLADTHTGLHCAVTAYTMPLDHANTGLHTMEHGGVPTSTDDNPFSAPGSSSTHTMSDRGPSGHSHQVAPPGCPAPWTPLSPSAYHLISPQFLHQHRVAPQDAQQAQHSHMRQFHSAVPMGMHGQRADGTPFGTSPPQQHSFMAAHHQKMVSSLRASPGQQQNSQLVQMPFASPALSECSSHLGMQPSPCMAHHLPSPHDNAQSSHAVPIPGSAHNSQGALTRVSPALHADQCIVQVEPCCAKLSSTHHLRSHQVRGSALRTKLRGSFLMLTTVVQVMRATSQLLPLACHHLICQTVL